MTKLGYVAAISGFFAVFGPASEAMAQCSMPPLYFNGASAELEGPMTVGAGKGCRFGLNGIQGSVDEARIVQRPKNGRAGVEGLNPYYIAKPGFTGQDEFAYAFIGKDQYGGPMRVVVKWKVTVVP